MKLKSVKVLEGKGVPFKLIELKYSAISISDVIEYAKEPIDPDEICKTIILRDESNKKHAVLLLGKHRIDFSKMKDVIGRKVRIASPEEVKLETGVEPGAVCPILLKIPLLVDGRVFKMEKINFGSGNHLYGLEISTKDLERAFEFELVDAAKT